MNDFSHITDGMLFDAIRKVAEAAPETVYRRTVPDHQETGYGACYYVHTDTDGNAVDAGCIIGKALHSLGVPLETLAEHERQSAHVVLGSLGIGSYDAQETARNIQISQDAGITWGSAVRYLPEFGVTA